MQNEGVSELKQTLISCHPAKIVISWFLQINNWTVVTFVNELKEYCMHWEAESLTMQIIY